LLCVRRNRTAGCSGSLLAPYSVDPGFLRTESLRGARQLTWQSDKQKGVATLVPREYKGPRLELPLRPMLGCIGTAPANNAAIPTHIPTISAATWITTEWGRALPLCCRFSSLARSCSWATGTGARVTAK